MTGTSHTAARASSISKPGSQMGEKRLTLEEMARRDMERAIEHGKIWDNIFSTLFDPLPISGRTD